MANKQQRIELVNSIIKIISSHGRRFFYNDGKNGYGERVAQIVIKNKRLCFVDDYTLQVVPIIDNSRRWRGFSHGGTLRGLILHFADFIRTGKPIDQRYIGLSWSTTAGNVWGYPEDSMEKVRNEVRQLLNQQPKC